MAPYLYKKLDTKKEEIRLITLLPGKRDDNIALSLTHVALKRPTHEPGVNPNRMSKSELQKTLPDDWMVQETFERRYLFIQLGQFGGPNTWDHPDPQFNRSLYDVHAQKGEQTLKFEPNYEALSYVWGPPQNPVEVQVVSTEAPSSRASQTLLLGRNLHSALKGLRHPTCARTLWVDAVCINQNDIDERNAQVLRMGDIYSLAARVVIWLGPEADDSTHALSTIGYFGDQVEHTMNGVLGDSPGASEPNWWQPQCSLPYDARTWSSLTALLSRAWFSRTWTIQEALLASPRSIIQCGDASIPWPTLRKALLVMHYKQDRPLELRNLAKLVPIYTCKVNSSLLHLLEGTKRRHCTDPHDRVYGILGLVSPSIRAQIKPDYSESHLQAYK